MPMLLKYLVARQFFFFFDLDLRSHSFGVLLYLLGMMSVRMWSIMVEAELGLNYDYLTEFELIGT
jgi:hypothetical protein